MPCLTGCTSPSSNGGKKPAACTTKKCAKKKTGGIIWKKQPGGTDADLTKAKKMWKDAKKRRLPDGSKPKSVIVMEALEKSDKTTTINVGGSGNGAGPENQTDAKNPAKGSNAHINFNPNKKGTMTGGIKRDPESSLAHEAYHAYEYTSGTWGATLEQQEKSATSVENTHRKAKGLPQRQKYGSWNIEQH